MLRLARGWSAEQLSQEYESQGTGSLNRATIAKIESETRQIKAGEVEGMARVFGVRSTDLLDPGGPTVLLSYAEQDGTAGQEVSAWLDDHGFRVRSPDNPDLDRQRPGSWVRREIDTAQAFVLLLSGSFLSSPQCREELDLAVRRKQLLATSDPATDFIFVLQVTDTSDLDTSGLRSYPWIDLVMVGGRKKEAALSQLGSRIILGNRAPVAHTDPASHAQSQQAFLDRRNELDRVLHDLSNPAGPPHFWLVISPPGLGKSWFLRQLAAEAAESTSPSWVTMMVDLRLDLAHDQRDAMTVVRKLFEFDREPSSEPADDLLGIAQKIIRTGRPCLCLLDSAELLPANEAAALRKHLSQVYHRLLQDAGNADAKLAFVVASRREDRWRGVTPSPRLDVLPLGEFGTATIQGGLDRLALRMHRVYSSAELRKDAERVRLATEGIPALVQQGLQWIQAEEWLEIERLNSPQLFKKIIEPYIRKQLLAHDSLLPGEEDQSEEPEKLTALRDALRALVPYRFFTLAHVYHHLDIDRSLGDALKDARWSVEDLWQAVADMALLYRPLDEPWHEIHAAIRRLLYSYFYAPDERADAHRRARDFTMNWADNQTGQDQIIGMVECIWHEAARLRLSDAAKMGEDLPEFVRKLSFAIRPSAYTETELRAYAAQRMRNDDELQREVAGIDGLFDQLVEAVLVPGSAGGVT